MEKKDYTCYSAEQLLEDDFFLESFSKPTPDSLSFWVDQTHGNEVLAKEVAYAKIILRSIPYRKRIFSSDDQELLWMRISETNHRKQLYKYWYSSVAAVLVLLLVTGSIYYTGYYKNNEFTAIEKVQKPEYPVETIQLILADEKKVSIEEKSSHLQYNRKGELHINDQKVQMDQRPVINSKGDTKLAYNQLIIPSSRRSFLELADGSKIWVNANTRVVYPVTFEDNKREIYVDGEIYIEVYPDKKRPFIVKSKKMDVRVLGTKFNISTYESNQEASVVLVSGKVNVWTDNRIESVLNPSDRLSYEKGTTDIRKVDVGNYISWKDGFYTFDNECFSTVLDRLSSYYGKRITYSGAVGVLRCSGSLNLDEDLRKVLTGLESTMPVIFTIEREYISVIVKPLK